MKSTSPDRFDWRVGLGLGAMLVLAWVAYLPGLGGGFLFDDFVNLDALGNHGPIDNWKGFWIYITSGSADPIGRPLALLSFLIDARDWPADPAPFLRSNVLLHLLNGVLLFGLLRQLGRTLDGDFRRNDAAALLATGLWLLHPLFVSTTLYIVQREAMLPATFTLGALWIYARARHRYRTSAGNTGLGTMALAIGIGTGMAMLCKANGILLPMLAWVVATCVFKAAEQRVLHGPQLAALRRQDRWLLVLPSLVVLAYLLRYLPQLQDPLAHRPWTIAERLLTEPRVILEYLKLLVVPRSISTGLFNDNYVVSTGWLQPASTIPAMALVVGLVALAFRSRVRAPRFAAALLFFFAGHVLESTTVPLELYFEHRNYLPAMLLFWPLAQVLVEWTTRPAISLAVAVALLALVGATTWQRASLWGQPERLTALWATSNPDSPRAQAVAAMALMKSGQFDQAAAQLKVQWQKQPGESQLVFNYVNARCAGSGLTPEDITAVDFAMRQSASSHLLINQWLSNALAVASENSCAGLTLDQAGRWIQAAIDNPVLAVAGRRNEDFEPLLGELAVYQGQPDVALKHFERALLSHPNPDFAARMVAFLADRGHFRQALALLDLYERQVLPPPSGYGMARIHAAVLDRLGYWPHELAVLRAKLNKEIAEQDREGKGQ